jgi:transposase-like protein
MWINNYPDLIVETQEQLLEREKSLRDSALENRVKMLRLLKSSAYPSQLRLAKALGYSPRQIRRWWKTYREDGLQALLEDKTHLRWANNKERVSQEALVALEEKMKAGQIARLEEVRIFLEEHFWSYFGFVDG